MGWRGYESEIDLGMLFRKMYCHKCGTRLKRKKITAIYHKGALNMIIMLQAYTRLE